jgi:hypothetical protein
VIAPMNSGRERGGCGVCSEDIIFLL